MLFLTTRLFFTLPLLLLNCSLTHVFPSNHTLLHSHALPITHPLSNHTFPTFFPSSLTLSLTLPSSLSAHAFFLFIHFIPFFPLYHLFSKWLNSQKYLIHLKTLIILSLTFSLAHLQQYVVPREKFNNSVNDARTLSMMTTVVIFFTFDHPKMKIRRPSRKELFQCTI